MTPIDLLDYTQSSKRIPSTFLHYKSKTLPQISTGKILLSFLVDFSAILMLTGMITSFLEISISSFMVTSSMNKAHYGVASAAFTSFLPVMAFLYFSASYFFNHGQSYGMYLFKTRINIPQMDFRASFRWTLFSMMTIMSGGILLKMGQKWMNDKELGSFEIHDHLYHKLILDRFISPVDLIQLTDFLETEAVETVDDFFQEAA